MLAPTGFKSTYFLPQEVYQKLHHLPAWRTLRAIPRPPAANGLPMKSQTLLTLKGYVERRTVGRTVYYRIETLGDPPAFVAHFLAGFGPNGHIRRNR